MIVLRRMLAFVLGLLLVVAFLVSLIASRVNSTVLAPSFYRQQIDAVQPFTVIHDQVLPKVVDDFLKNQNAKLPDNLSAIALPTDPQSEQAILDLLRIALLPEVLRTQADAAIDQLVPYLAGRTAHFDVRLRLGDQLRAVAGHAAGQPSRLQQTWDRLDLATQAIKGLVDQYAQHQGIASTAENANFLTAVAGDPNGASQWLETQMFGAIDQLLPYLDGDAPHFHVVISFKAYPALAAPFAQALHRTPEQLLTEGFVLDDQQINAELAKSNREELNRPNNALNLFRPAGYSITEQQLTDLTSKQDGFNLVQFRTWASRFGAARWAALGVVLLLLLAIGFLGGRRWWSRLAWAAAALLVASAIGYALTGPVYTSMAGSRLHDQIVRLQAQDGGTLQPLRDRVLSQSEVVVDGIASGMATTSRNWGVLSVLALVGAAGWAYYDRMEEPDAGEAPGL